MFVIFLVEKQVVIMSLVPVFHYISIIINLGQEKYKSYEQNYYYD